MCGIVGGFKALKKSELKVYWERLEHRGTDSFGILTFGNKVKTTKNIFQENLKYKILKSSSFVIAHNRKGSIGNIYSLKLAHPVKYKHIAVIHNGTNRDLYRIVKEAESDTHAISIIAAYLKRPKDVFSFLENIGVVFIIDTEEKKLYFHRDSSRPLYYNHDLKIFASEPIDLGEWIKVTTQQKVLDLENIEKEWTSKIKLAKEYKVEILEPLKLGKCLACGKEKYIIAEEKICPHCKAQGKEIKKKKEDSWLERYYRSIRNYPYYSW